MARMIPPNCPVSTANSALGAEISVWHALHMLPDDWIVLHSLWIAKHLRKPHAESDFIVISERGVLMLEIKGGQIERREGIWRFFTNSGHLVQEKTEGPFDQARGMYYAMRSHLADCGLEDVFYAHTFGYGVITPDCVPKLPRSDAAIEPELLLSLDRFPQGVRAFLDDLYGYWSERHFRGGGGSKTPVSLSRARQTQTLGVLRPDFDYAVGIGVDCLRAEQQLRRLTERQLEFLDFCANDCRVVIRGAAGTGKTVLAVKQALNEARCGRRVLFTCFNRWLADHLRRVIARQPGGELVTVGNYHQIALRALQNYGLGGGLDDGWSVFNEKLPELTLELATRATNQSQYDYLVVDEAQDLLKDAFIDFLDISVKGGLVGGRWLMALDPHQSIYHGDYAAGRAKNLIDNARTTVLQRNCRNTKPVAVYVRGLSGCGSAEVKGTDGPQPRIQYYRSATEYLKLLRKTVNDLIASFIESHTDPANIVILCRSREYLPLEIFSTGFFLRSLVEAGSDDNLGSIRWSTIHRFKGLESRAVVVVGIESLDDDDQSCLLYVGASRATTSLTLLFAEDCRASVTVRMPHVLQLFAEPEHDVEFDMLFAQ